ETANVTLRRDSEHDLFEIIPGDYVMLAVTDDGIGMNEETKAKIFEPFFTTKNVGEGTGLGLATCYGIIKQNKGYIWVYSEPGKGTTFKIYLPRNIKESGEKTVKKESSPSPGGSETIIIVEDEEAVKNMIIRMLSTQGYNVFSASNGSEALELIEKNNIAPDLLITDVIMPHMGGRELQLIVSSIQPSVKTLFISGYTGKILSLHGLDDPDVEIIRKPFPQELLLGKVRMILDSA
ncbi:ATP-binding protein, partial [Candidatus Latescibacterota bacterium]